LNLKDILELIDKVADRGIGLVEIEQAGVRVKIEGRLPPPAPGSQGQGGEPRDTFTQAEASVPPAGALRGRDPAPAGPPEDDTDPAWHIVTSPIVGTFYRAPNPESDIFVNVGDRVIKGKVLCIIEAMKLMNEIESDIDGEIARIYPQNGQPVEYGERLFAVRI
jgi:acetyl-CoA carboxylase biotin carboxyl carrier protein